MTEFTPGPWVVVDGNTSGKEVICPSTTKNKLRIARMGGPDRDANAHLIAAAPDLYEALEKIMRMDLSWGYDKAMGKSQEIAYLALAKARGE